MDTELIITIITAIGTLSTVAYSAYSNNTSNALLRYRMEQIEGQFGKFQEQIDSILEAIEKIKLQNNSIECYINNEKEKQKKGV